MVSEECYIHILDTMCAHIDIWCYGVWSCARKSVRRINVSFNYAVRKIFHYNR